MDHQEVDHQEVVIAKQVIIVLDTAMVVVHVLHMQEDARQVDQIQE